MEVLIESQLGVHDAGYAWVQTERNKDESLEPNTAGGVHTTTLYDPFRDSPLLFSEFSQIERSKEAVLDFANRRGLLLGTHYARRIGADTLPTWAAEIEAMRFAIEVQSAIAVGDMETLGQVVNWPDGADHCQYNIPEEVEPALHPSWPGRCRAMEHWLFGKMDVIGPAESLVTSIIEWKTQSPKCQFFFGLENESEVVIHIDELLQTLWFQFALAVRGRGVRFCQHCGKPFAMNVRSDQTLCSKNCTVLDTYHRKKKAQRMRAEGASLRDIAKTIGAKSKSLKENMAQVKKWIS